MQPLISVIIPIYNVEPYLRRCLDSVLHQTYPNLEIILVDDGSPDNCPSICDEYANNDTRIVVIHKKNGGLSDARNAGLDICKGDYITFVDSDDSISHDYAECLLNVALKNDADIAIGRISNSKSIETNKTTIFSPEEALLGEFESNPSAFITSWGKLFTKDLWTTIRFPPNKVHEDVFTTYLIFHKAKKIAFLDTILYNFFIREGSITSAGFSLDLLEAQENRYLFIKKVPYKKLIVPYLIQLSWNLLFAYSDTADYSKQEMYLAKFKMYAQELFTQKNIPLFHGLFLKIFHSFPRLYFLYRKNFRYHLRKHF